MAASFSLLRAAEPWSSADAQWDALVDAVDHQRAVDIHAIEGDNVWSIHLRLCQIPQEGGAGPSKRASVNGLLIMGAGGHPPHPLYLASEGKSLGLGLKVDNTLEEGGSPSVWVGPSKSKTGQPVVEMEVILSRVSPAVFFET